MAWPFEAKSDLTFENIKKDLAAFANQGTLKTDDLGTKMVAEWQERQLSKKATFTIQRGNKLIVDYNSQRSSYYDFMSSSYMADMNFTANQMRSLISRCDNYIDARAILEEDSAEKKKCIDNASLFNDIVNEQILTPEIDSDQRIIDATQVLFVRGQAGMGKTIAAKELARAQADSYIAGKTNYLFFYIDAQARALARIGEAIALETQNSGLSFTHNAVNALTRNGLLVPIIDGFDELIGSGGFADAFKSLSSFLSTLERNGSVIATSRSTFFDTNILSFIADQFNNNDSINYRIHKIEICQWSDEDINKYFSNRFAFSNHPEKKISEINKLVKSMPQSNYELLRKPFYCVQIANLAESEFNSEQDYTDDEFKPLDSINDSLLEHLITYFLNREKDKFKNRYDQPILNTEGHRRFLEYISLELWWQESRIIDQETLLLVGEMIIDEFKMPPEDQPILIGKITSHALLRTEQAQSPQSTHLSFESAAYFDYFLSFALLRMILNESSVYLKQFLSRSLLSDSFTEFFSSLTKQHDANTIFKCIEKINDCLENSPVGGLARQNGGQIVCAMLAGRTDINNVTVKNIDGFEVSLNNFETKNSAFINCNFRKIRLFNCVLENVIFIKTSFLTVYLSRNTKLDGTTIEPGIYFNHLIYEEREIVDPNEIRSIINKMGATSPDQVANYRQLNRTQREYLDLISTLGDKAKSRFYFDDNPDNEPLLRSILRDQHWDGLKKMLIKTGILEKKSRDRSGKSQYLYRLTCETDEILAAVNNPVSPNIQRLNEFYNAFWSLKH